MKLYTSGCSFTEWCWPTWADYLGREFAEYENLGLAGADNPTIARSVISKAQVGDTVVILWSGFDRWSTWSDKALPIPRNPDNHWFHKGTMFNNKKAVIHGFYHPVERFLNTMDSIQLVDFHSKLVGYNAYHFSAFPIFKGDVEETVHPEIPKLYNNYSIKNNYLTELSLRDYKINSGQEYSINHKYQNNDRHPTPKVHWEYLNQYIAPALGINLTTKLEQVLEDQEKILQGIVN